MNKLKLKVYWSKKEKDFVVSYPSKSDGGWILTRLFGTTTTVLPQSTGVDLKLKELAKTSHNPYLAIFEVPDFIQELTNRGYDKTTLKFEVQVDINKILNQFPHLLDRLTAAEKNKLEKLKKK